MNYWYFRLKSSDFPPKHLSFERLLWLPSKHYVNNFNISKTFKGVSNALQNFRFIGATVFEIAGGGRLDLPFTNRLGKGRVNGFPLYFALSSFKEMKSTFIKLQNEPLPKAIGQELLLANNNV